MQKDSKIKKVLRPLRFAQRAGEEERNADKMKISVIGSLNMDMTVTADRIPLKGETLQGSKISYNPGGKGANQAVAMARLGAQVEMFGCVGTDNSGKDLLDNLKKNGVQTEHIREINNCVTGTAFITVGDGDNTIIIISGANEQVDCAYVDSIKNSLSESDMVVLQHEIPMETIEYIVNFCWENKIPILLNPAPARLVKTEIIEKVTYLTPNEHEAKLIFGEGHSLESMLSRYPEKLIVTLGAKGVACCLKTGEIINIPCRSSKVADTTGAGDTFNGAFALRIAEGADIEEALRFANIAAGLSVEKFGAQGGMPYREQVLEELAACN